MFRKDFFHLEDCAALNTLSLPVVTSSVVSHLLHLLNLLDLLDRAVEVVVIKGEGRVVDIGSWLFGNCIANRGGGLIGRSFLVNVGFSGNVNVDVGFGLNFFVNVSVRRDGSIDDIVLRVFQWKLGGGTRQADDDGKNNLEEKYLGLNGFCKNCSFYNKIFLVFRYLFNFVFMLD
jgi:hypothetical protein